MPTLTEIACDASEPRCVDDYRLYILHPGLEPMSFGLSYADETDIVEQLAESLGFHTDEIHIQWDHHEPLDCGWIAGFRLVFHTPTYCVKEYNHKGKLTKETVGQFFVQNYAG